MTLMPRFSFKRRRLPAELTLVPPPIPLQVAEAASPVTDRGFHEILLKWHNRFVHTGIIDGENIPWFSEIANFRVLSGLLCCGSQPTRKGFSWLIQQGVKTVVTFRKESPKDSEWRDRFGINHVVIPIPDRDVPTLAQVETFLRIVDDPDYGKVFAHCRGGTGRTQTMIACWQVAHGYSAEQAIQEALALSIKYSIELPINVSFSITFSMNQKQQKFVRDFESFWKKNSALSKDNLSVTWS